ncbi:YqhG family protein [Rossellomorea aquimaris]|uniref:YqhG family protein n=1 Tax=Rossellomorea aquimaris TaxID=189382 RepID=UPI001CD1E28D|nr:YqhG family protein [Rossellomorea aquimaris]MCA1054803.1 YqhG family protein [Rossellomorea aquimaris]
MQQHEIHRFLERYFTANGCELLASGEGYMTVQLTIDLDKELMNRPFYWHYLEKTGGVPNPMTLSLITDGEKAPEDLKGELIHFGSPRLHQIFRSTRNLAGYIRLYEERNGFSGQQVPLHPWLGLNIKLSHVTNLKKDSIESIGLNLINGQIKEDFHSFLLSKKLTPKIPDFSFTLTPIIKPKSGINRIQSHLMQGVQTESFTWADEARKRWDEDLRLLDHFYGDHEEMPEAYELEKQALKEQYEPKISIDIINGGIFYLQQPQ